MNGTRTSLLGFLAMAFAVVGLTGLLAASIAPLPLQRAVQREAVLDQALVLGRQGDRAGLESLKPQLGDSADAVLGVGDIEALVAAERTAQRTRRIAEADEVGLRLKLMLVVVTLLAGGFGVGMMMAGRKVAPQDGLR